MSSANNAEITVTMDRIGKAGLVPVVVIGNADDAVPAAKALLDGELDVMEITMRTEAGLEAIKRVSAECPEMLVGAGTVLNVEKAKACVEAGAKFIVSPGFNPSIVDWCIENGVAVTPGCVTPTEITMALEKGINVVKFFPGDVYGGIKGCKSLYAPFATENLKFLPTGGVGNDNLAEFATKPFIHAVGGSWLCAAADISSHNFSEITASVKKAVSILLGFEFLHMGINAGSPEASDEISSTLSKGFGLEIKTGEIADFAGCGIEIMKAAAKGKNGHIAIGTNSVYRAVYYLQKRGFEPDMENAKYKGKTLNVVYMKNEVGGFAIHLVQK